MDVKKILRWTIRLGLLGAFLTIIGIGAVYILYGRDLPAVDTLREVQLEVPLRVFSADGRLISVFGERRRIPVSGAAIPACIKQAFLAGEDARFYEHPGVDWQGISRAVFHLVRTGEKTVGGSTITQQLARNFFLSFEKTYVRKLKEIFLALKIERELSKQEILELYLNKIFLGHRAYGVGAAAQVYYGKQLHELSLAQCAMIAALPKAPSRINPISSPERALERRNYVLDRLRELDYIGVTDHQAAIAEKDLAFYHGPTVEVDAPFVAEMVRAKAVNQLGEQAYSGGYTVKTTLDSRLQLAANAAVRNGLHEYDRRHGYRGPEAQIELNDSPDSSEWDRALQGYRSLAGLQPGLVIQVDPQLALIYFADGQTVALELEAMAWASQYIDTDKQDKPPESVDQVLVVGDIVRLKLDDDGNWRLSQLPQVESSLVSMDPLNGAIRALVGGFEFQRSKFNRALQSRRQPGSSFKPFIYSAALDKGYTTATLVNDAPVVYEDELLEKTWKPQNFSERIYGPTRLREAMVNSRNLVSIRLLEDIGVEYARDYISQFGFQRDQLPPDLSMALGSATLTPLSMANGYSVFANGGYRTEPYFIEEIRDPQGELIYQSNPVVVCQDCPAITPPEEPPEESDEGPVVLELSLDNDQQQAESEELTVEESPPPRIAPRVISPQNAFLIRSMMMDVIRRGTGRGVMEIGRNDLAGKTGTTNEQRDAWFSGYNSTLVTTVWVGFDDHKPLGRGELGGKAALPIWREYMGFALDGIPEDSPIMPNGLVQVRINPESGLLARVGDPVGIMEVFRRGQLPETEISDPSASNQEQDSESPYDLF